MSMTLCSRESRVVAWLLCVMYRELWEGETDAFGVERLVDCLLCVEIYGPIICALDPKAYGDVYAAGREAAKGY